MSSRTDRQAPWDTRNYPRIVSASYQSGTLAVSFADGATAEVPVEAFSQRRGVRDWDRVSYTEYEIVVPREAEEEDEIPWDVIRSLTDPAFAAHLDAMAEESGRWVGKRVRELRQGRGLKIAALAGLAGVLPSLVADIERGNHDGDLGELQRVVEAMGHGMRDLIRPEADARTVASRTA
jgi:hypothetical protein